MAVVDEFEESRSAQRRPLPIDVDGEGLNWFARRELNLEVDDGVWWRLGRSDGQEPQECGKVAERWHG